jgi:hypothetical protein
MSTRVQDLQSKLAFNMNKAVILANKNTVRNKQGYAVLKKDDREVFERVELEENTLCDDFCELWKQI